MMTNPIQHISVEVAPVDKREALRYCGARDTDANLCALLEDSICETAHVLHNQICYRLVPVTIRNIPENQKNGPDSAVRPNHICHFGSFEVCSDHLSRRLEGCRRAVIFVATIGVAYDRLIARYARISPARALILQGLGAERVEALCDGFCHFLETEGYRLRPRFSPGYGDLPLSAQADICQLLDSARQMGVSLNDSFLLSPSKTVTAIVGIEPDTPSEQEKQA